LFCDNTSTINLTRNPVQHSRTKHIEIRHHFIRGHVNNGDCEIQFVVFKKQLVDLFTKPLNKERFNFLRTELGIIDLSNLIWHYLSNSDKVLVSAELGQLIEIVILLIDILLH